MYSNIFGEKVSRRRSRGHFCDKYYPNVLAGFNSTNLLLVRGKSFPRLDATETHFALKAVTQI